MTRFANVAVPAIPRRLCFAITMALLATPALGQRWTSEDGFVSVSPPDTTKYPNKPSPMPPVMLAIWESPDGATKFEVVRVPLPPGSALTQQQSEKSWASAVDGPVRRLPTKKLGQFEVWRLNAEGRDVEMTQAMVLTKEAAYALRVSSLGGHSDEHAVMRFLDSLTVDPSALTAPPPTPPAAARTVNPLPLWIALALLLLIVAAVTRYVLRSPKR